MFRLDIPENLFDRAGGEAGDELAREDDVDHDDRQDRHRQRGEHRIPVGDVLAQELLHAERDRVRLVARGQDQRMNTSTTAAIIVIKTPETNNSAQSIGGT